MLRERGGQKASSKVHSYYLLSRICEIQCHILATDAHVEGWKD